MKAKTLLNLVRNFDFNGVSFISIKGYCSDKSENSEVADVFINIGTSYEKAKKSDFDTLKHANAKELANAEFDAKIIEEAIREKLLSNVRPSETRSQGQRDAYISLNKSNTLKYCKETESVVIFGAVVRKTVRIPGIYKETKSRPLTLAKKHIEEVLDLKTSKFRNYKLSNIAISVKVNGNTIEIE